MTASVLPSAAENELYQELVVEHKRAPRHFGTLAARHPLPWTGLRDLHRVGIDDDRGRAWA